MQAGLASEKRHADRGEFGDAASMLLCCQFRARMTSVSALRLNREVGGHFHRPFVIGDSALAGRRVTAWFDDEPVEAVVNTVCLVVGADCVVGDTIEVGR